MTVLGHGPVTSEFTGEVWAHGEYAWTSTWSTRGGDVGDSFRVWDVRGDVPQLVRTETVTGATTTGDIQVSDDGRLLVVATERQNGSIAIYDNTDPASPLLLSRYSTSNTTNGVHTAEVARVNGTLHAFLSVDPAGSSPARLTIVSLADPRNPQEVFSRSMGSPFIHDVFVRDGLLFTALWNGGMTIWDIGGAGCGGTVAAPRSIGNVFTVGGQAHNIWWLHDPVTGSKRYAFVGEEDAAQLFSFSSGDIHVVDISNPTEPREVAFYTVPNAGTHNFSVDEQNGILYAAYYNGGVRALDVRGDLGTCTAAQKAADGRCNLGLMGREMGRGLLDRGIPIFVWGVRYLNGFVYASDMPNGLWKLRGVTRAAP